MAEEQEPLRSLMPKVVSEVPASDERQNIQNSPHIYLEKTIKTPIVCSKMSLSSSPMIKVLGVPAKKHGEIFRNGDLRQDLSTMEGSLW